jgi:hypothetical protein
MSGNYLFGPVEGVWAWIVRAVLLLLALLALALVGGALYGLWRLFVWLVHLAMAY